MSLYKRKDSSVWWLKVTVNGQMIQRSTGTTDKANAQEYHDKLKSDLWEQSRLGVKPRRYWWEAVGRWLQETSDKRTHSGDIAKLRWLDTYLSNSTLNEITLSKVDLIKSAKLAEASKSTVNRYLALLRSILIKARDDWEWIDKVPKIKLYAEPRGRERALTREEAARLLQELPEHQRDTVTFALMSGLRQANVLGLEWSWINFSMQYLCIPAEKSKNNSPITVHLTASMLAILKKQIGKHPSRVFSYQGKPIAAANTRAWKNARIRAGIENFRWHDLRHTWATWHRQAGTPTHELQRLGAWKTTAMVERYAHIAPDALKGATGRLENFMSGYDLATVSQKEKSPTSL
ncbi:MAG: site-specific integrase [Betaproteobacteria bacterium HGW-Betaproteobacteria-22]|nr:MAG: site-specific integrase [Betaproteobacteria bacterium HGW-Betaproteobacteria-22]